MSVLLFLFCQSKFVIKVHGRNKIRDPYVFLCKEREVVPVCAVWGPQPP